MAVIIRLRRAGKKNQAFYHIVATDSRSPRDGKFIEKLGYYNPKSNPSVIEVKSDRVLYWLSKGASISRTVSNLLKKKGIIGSAKSSENPLKENKKE